MAIGRAGGRWIFCCALAAYVQVVEHGLQEGPIRERPAASCPSNICSTAEHHYASVFAPSQAGLLSPVIEFGARRDCIRASCAEHGSSLETYQDDSSRNEWISKSSRVFSSCLSGRNRVCGAPALIRRCEAATLTLQQLVRSCTLLRAQRARNLSAGGAWCITLQLNARARADT